MERKIIKLALYGTVHACYYPYIPVTCGKFQKNFFWNFLEFDGPIEAVMLLLVSIDVIYYYICKVYCMCVVMVIQSNIKAIILTVISKRSTFYWCVPKFSQAVQIFHKRSIFLSSIPSCVIRTFDLIVFHY